MVVGRKAGPRMLENGDRIQPDTRVEAKPEDFIGGPDNVLAPGSQIN